MTDLIDHIEEVNRQVDGLSESNNKIVENISQLSAATEEVTASAEQVHGMSEQNLQFAEQVQQAVDKMRAEKVFIRKELQDAALKKGKMFQSEGDTVFARFFCDKGHPVKKRSRVCISHRNTVREIGEHRKIIVAVSECIGILF
jgi:hypothetical protein